MSGKIYKYLDPNILELALAREGFVGFRCSYPKDYNDPYELFLSIDTNIEPELLAFYKESVGEIPQYPTTCFSRSPTVVPMWAHYGHSSRGFVLEVDEARLREHFDDMSIGNVSYADSVDEGIVTSLARAFGTRKSRHTFFFHKQVMASAYFTKQTCWSYEQERRVVVPQISIEEIGGNMIFFAPIECVTSLIAGPRIEEQYWRQAEEVSTSLSFSLYRGHIGKSYPSIFFKDKSNKVFVFSDDGIVQTAVICKECAEPINRVDNETALCSWCSITENHEIDAARSNPYRILNQLGLLEEHVKAMESIGVANPNKALQRTSR